MENDHRVTAADVADYLTSHADFFDLHPDLLLPFLPEEAAPAGTISFSQRQIELLRVKKSELEIQLNTLMALGEANSELQTRVHLLCLELIDAKSIDKIVPILSKKLRIEFGADEVSLRLFYRGDLPAVLPPLVDNVQQISLDGLDLAAFAGLLHQLEPLCGRLTSVQRRVLFGDKGEKVKSAGCVSLGDSALGMLAIGSYDENRFHANMGTVYLSFLGDILARLLQPYMSRDDG